MKWKIWNPLRLLNPFIWFINFFNHMAYLENYRYVKKYKEYDYSQDLKYFK